MDNPESPGDHNPESAAQTAMTRLGALALILGAFLALGASPALATGTYEVRTCNATAAGENGSWTWSTNETAQPAHLVEHASCPDRIGGSGGISDQEGGLSTTDALGLSSGAQPGTSASWNFNTPAGTTIAAVSYERYLGHQLDPFNEWSPGLRVDGALVPSETCLDTSQNGETCSVGTPPGGASGVLSGLAAQQLSFGINCDAPIGDECVTGASQHEVWAAIYGATVTVADATAPTLNGPTGSLWGDGFHKGAQDVVAAAEDSGGGVQSISLRADGHLLSSYVAPCNFTLAQPCSTSTGPQTLELPTSELADGAHKISLVATDAAGNESAVVSKEILVDNNAPAAPIGLAVTPTERGSSTFTATWTDPPGQASPIAAATYQVCAAGGPCEAATAAPLAGPVALVAPGVGSWTLAVWLTDAAGNGTPVNAARVDFARGPAQTRPVMVPAASKPTIKISEALRGRDLVAQVRGAGGGKLRVSFTAKLDHKTVASGARTGALKHGLLSATFKLGPRTAAHAEIRVSARLGSQRMVVSTLVRRRERRRIFQAPARGSTQSPPLARSAGTPLRGGRCDQRRSEATSRLIYERM